MVMKMPTLSSRAISTPSNCVALNYVGGRNLQHSLNRFSYLESLVFVDEGVLDGLDLRGDDRQNGDVDSVELIEAAPGPTLTQT